MSKKLEIVYNFENNHFTLILKKGNTQSILDQHIHRLYKQGFPNSVRS